MARVVDDLAAAFASHKIYNKQAEGAEDVTTLHDVVNTFGQRAADICHDLFRRHTRADPYGVPETPDHSIHEEFWTLHSDSRDVEGENMVKELASYIREANRARAQQGMPEMLFADPFFGPNVTALFADPSTAGKNANAAQSERRDLDPFLANMDIQSIKWKRPHEFGDPNLKPVIYSGGIDPDDVGQGQLGNCYFLAAIQSCGSEKEDFLVKDLCIEDEEVACCGMYGVKFFLHGQWVTVLVDDRIPCTWDGRHWQPIFAKPMKHNKQETGEKELWALIFEKAWAKLNLSYEATDGGLTGDTTNYLTGGTITQHDVEEENWDMLASHTADMQRVAYLSCSIRPGLPEAPNLLHTWGLMDGHAYSCLQLRQARNGQRFVQVRNPWGDANEWKGRFSDRDRTSWTPELKQELAFQAQNDGTFWMLWEDFMYFFGTIEVCDPIAIARVTEGHHEHCRVDVFSSHWIRGQTAGGPASCTKTFKHNPVCTLQVETSGPVELSLYQPDVRPVQNVTNAKQLTASLYLVDTHTGKRTELFESSRRVTCHSLEHAVAGRVYHLIASAWAPGVQSAFWITAAGSGATLDAGPGTHPTKEEDDLMSLQTPREMCCVVCHQEDDEGYYQTAEGYKCESCQKGRRKALQGKGHDPNRPATPKAAPRITNYTQKQPGQPTISQPDVPNLMSLAMAQDRPDLGMGGGPQGGYAGGPQDLTSGGRFPQQQPQQQQQYDLQTQPAGNEFASMPTQNQPQDPFASVYSPDGYAAPAVDPRSPQMQCYYCDTPLFNQHKMTQYGPCCNPPCWEGRPAPQTEQTRVARAAAPVQQQAAPLQSQPQPQPQPQPVREPAELACYYCEKRLTGNYQMTQYGPSCSPGCWDRPSASPLDTSYAQPSRYLTQGMPPMLSAAAPYVAPASFPAVGSASPPGMGALPPMYGGFGGPVLPRAPVVTAPFQSPRVFAPGPLGMAYPGPGQVSMMGAGPAPLLPTGGTVVYGKPSYPGAMPMQWGTVPNSPALSRRPSNQMPVAMGGFPVMGGMPVASQGFQQPFGRPYF